MLIRHMDRRALSGFVRVSVGLAFGFAFASASAFALEEGWRVGDSWICDSYRGVILDYYTSGIYCWVEIRGTEHQHLSEWGSRADKQQSCKRKSPIRCGISELPRFQI